MSLNKTTSLKGTHFGGEDNEKDTFLYPQKKQNKCYGRPSQHGCCRVASFMWTHQSHWKPLKFYVLCWYKKDDLGNIHFHSCGTLGEFM